MYTIGREDESTRIVPSSCTLLRQVHGGVDTLLQQVHGGVDKFDHMTKVYGVLRKCYRWPSVFLYKFLDTAVVNSFVIFKHLNPDTTMSHFGFHLAITKQLAELFSESRFGPQRPLPTPAPDPTAAPAAEPVTAPVPVATTTAQSPSTAQLRSTERPLEVEVDQLFVVP